MLKYLTTSCIALLIPLCWAFLAPRQVSFSPRAKLSDYGFFIGNLADMKPAPDMIPYEVNSPLFTDYAHKQRFIFLPPGAKITYNDSVSFSFPVGTAIVKNIYYPLDEQDPSKGQRIVETRVLIHDIEGWIAMPYLWDDTQTDATLAAAGASTPVTWRDDKGQKRELNYVVPNTGQCKRCHLHNKKLSPLGPSARQLNGTVHYPEGDKNQLEHWASKGILTGFAHKTTDVPALVHWGNPAHSVETRARSWLDVNCGHCHNPEGAASFTELRLDYWANNPSALGVLKVPEVADRWTVTMRYDIEPGKPDQSVLLHRMESTIPGIMMPELGRKMVHREGVELIREWISSMK